MSADDAWFAFACAGGEQHDMRWDTGTCFICGRTKEELWEACKRWGKTLTCPHEIVDGACVHCGRRV